MGTAIAERKRKAREARKPKPQITITKAVWDAMPKEQRKRHADGTRHIKKNLPGGKFEWVCVDWKS